MDRRGRWIVNRMIERLWRSLKYEDVYLKAFETGSGARRGIGDWISYHNQRRPQSAHVSPQSAHLSAHDLLTPAEVYDTQNNSLKTAAGLKPTR
jgi:putative transposase